MIAVEELSNAEIIDILGRVGYGHLGCARDNKPYVVPVHYAFANGEIFIYTTEGKKFEIIKSNPNVCLQVEEVTDNQHWQSVVIEGIADQITDEDERAKAFKLVIEANPTLTPAVSVRWIDDMVRENIEVIYRVTPTETSGRRTRN